MSTKFDGLERRLERLERTPLLRTRRSPVDIDLSLLTSQEREEWTSYLERIENRVSFTDPARLRQLSDDELDEMERWAVLFQQRQEGLQKHDHTR